MVVAGEGGNGAYDYMVDSVIDNVWNSAECDAVKCYRIGAGDI